MHSQGYQHNVAITIIPGTLLRRLFRWKEVEMFSEEGDARARPETGIGTAGS